MKFDVLDHGYVEFCEAWGHGGNCEDGLEAGIICAARQSTQGSFRGWERDLKLLAFLYDNRHATPFEFAGMTIEVQAPIFVFREWHRHRTQSYNEASARYEPLPELYYLPPVERIMLDGGSNKQAQGSKPLTLADAELFRANLQAAYEVTEETYWRALSNGVPKELARCVMPVGHYSRMRATANLRNWLAFLTLRMDPAAQFEIRQYAQAVGQIVARKFPRTWALFGAQLEAPGT